MANPPADRAPTDRPDPTQQSTERLRQSEERYRLLVESVKDYAIFMLDPTGHILTWNVGAERLKRYTAAEIIGKHFSTFYTQDAKDRKWPEEELRRAVAEGRLEDEGWRVRKDGTRFWANVVITPLFDTTDRLTGFAKVTRDLTERMAGEEQARQLARAEAARVEAEAAARQKDEYLAMLAHELRNPLAPVLTTVTTLRIGGTDPRVLADGLDRIERQARHLGRLVNDLLEASRVARGRITLRPERMDLGALARAVVGDQRPAFDRAGVQVTADTPPTPVWVQADPTRLTQVLSNLLDNAAKFSQPGGHVTVRVRADAAAKRAVLAVADTGIGIDPAVLPRLFQPFVQGDRSLARGRGGLGLGLSVVKGLVELHGGAVAAHSEGPGKGAEITARLPLEAEPSALTAVSPAAGEATARALRVLVIEDNPDAAESLRVLLEVLGHQVRVATTGTGGVMMARSWVPDVVVSDIGLPELDGYAVARQLRQDPATSKTRLVALTGYGSDEDVRRATEAGFDAHLTKPAEPWALTDALREDRPGVSLGS
jgi:PAS domain S-box-containing protein